MKKLTLLLTLLFAIAACTSCKTEIKREINLEQIIYDRYWSGDLGFYDQYGPLTSVVYFGDNGTGFDLNRNPESGQPIEPLMDFRWQAHSYGTIIIDYYRDFPAYPRELRNVYYDYLTLTGDLYIGGEYIGRRTLLMEL